MVRSTRDESAVGPLESTLAEIERLVGALDEAARLPALGADPETDYEVREAVARVRTWLDNVQRALRGLVDLFATRTNVGSPVRAADILGDPPADCLRWYELPDVDAQIEGVLETERWPELRAILAGVVAVCRVRARRFVEWTRARVAEVETAV